MRCSRWGRPLRAFDVAAVFYIDLNHLRARGAAAASKLVEHSQGSAALLFGRLRSTLIQSDIVKVRYAPRAYAFRQYQVQPIQRTACAIHAPMQV